jgi:hypothetical protein
MTAEVDLFTDSSDQMAVKPCGSYGDRVTDLVFGPCKGSWNRWFTECRYQHRGHMRSLQFPRFHSRRLGGFPNHLDIAPV